MQSDRERLKTRSVNELFHEYFEHERKAISYEEMNWPNYARASYDDAAQVEKELKRRGYDIKTFGQNPTEKRR